MKHLCLQIALIALLIACGTASPQAGFFDNLSKGLGIIEVNTSGTSLDDSTIARGLKEALSTSTTRAVKLVSQQDGYFGNEMIKIMMPEKVRSTAELLGRFGFQAEVDSFVLSMNRAAETAAPKATEYFISALKEMTFDDARKILQGDKTSATAYFKQKTGDKIYAAFKPVVTSSMQEVGVTRNYNQMMDRFRAIPFAGSVVSFDLDHYVTTKAVDGLFHMLGEEERRIRTDPIARSTELLRKVFGR